MMSPEGTLILQYQSVDLLDKSKSANVLLEMPAGQHYFKIERGNDFCMHYYYSSPGTGTRVATVDLNRLINTTFYSIGFSWSPNEIQLFLWSLDQNGKSVGECVISKGEVSNKQFRIGSNGCVYQIGDHGVTTYESSVYENGKAVIQTTAIEAWRATIRGIETLSTGQSAEGYQYEAVVSNLTLVLLVTGFEAYTKKRFIELEQEGIGPNTSAVIKSFYPAKEIEIGIEKVSESEAQAEHISTLHYIVRKNIINFQSFDKCKKAYKNAYGIKFGEIGFPSEKIQDMRSYFRYRHKIIHVSATNSCLNQDRLPSESPVFSGKEFASSAINNFREFVEKLHVATLNLRPQDGFYDASELLSRRVF